MCIAAQVILSIGVAVSLVEAALVIPIIVGATIAAKNGGRLEDGEEVVADAIDAAL